MVDWKFGRRQGGCAKCEREFLEKEPHVSVLCLDDLEEGRRDFCRECFADHEPEATADPGRVWWRTRHTVAEKKGVQLDLESLHGLFDALADREETGWRELRYLLCLILMRKRRLKVLAVERDEGRELFIVKKPRVDERESVEVFDFTSRRQEELRGTLHAIFEGADLEELDPDAPVPVAEPEAEEEAGAEGAVDPPDASAESEAEASAGQAPADPGAPRENGADASAVAS